MGYYIFTNKAIHAVMTWIHSRFYVCVILTIVLLSCPLKIHANDADVHKRIASIDSLWREDKYDEALPLIHQALPLIIREYGKESTEYFQFLSMSSQIYSDADNNKQALVLIDEVIKGVRKVLGTDNLIYAKALSNKGLFYIGLGYAAKSIPIFGEAIQIFDSFGASLYYATCLKDLGIAYYDTGQYDKAQSSVSKADQILMVSGSTIKDAEYVSIKNAAIALEDEFGDSKESIKESISLLNDLQTNNLHIQQQSNILLGLVSSYLNIGEYGKAIEVGRKLIQFNEEKGLDKTQRDLGTIQYYLGLAYLSLNDYARAKDVLLLSLKNREQTLGVSHPYTIGVLSHLVDALTHLKDEKGLTKYARQLFERANNDFLSQFPRLDASGQVNYWNELYSSLYLNTLPNLCVKFNNPEIFQIAYDGLLMSKGILLESDVRFKHELRYNEDPSYFKRYERLESERRINYANTDSLDYEEQKLRSDFIKSSNYLDVFKISWKDVKAALGDNEVAIEFALSELPDSDKQLYSALLVSNKWEHPKFIQLFSSDVFEAIAKDDFYNTTALSALIWKPLIDLLDKNSVIYFSPIGELYNVAIENLPYPNLSDINSPTDCYISDKYSLIRLNSTRDIINKPIRTFIVSATLFGDMNYDGFSNSNAVHDIAKHAKRGNDYRSGFGPLPGTRIEIENINKLLNPTGIEISTYSKERGTKQSFMAMSGVSSSILHIATHGFYTPTKDSNKSGLDCSGLAFSGFNLFIGKDVKNNESCITATEISQMDLYNTDLAVLSACQTGLGKIETDGVFGLQRGFKMAGVNTLMMSLWEVNDDATQILMSEFYKNYVRGISKQDSLRYAQRAVRETPGFSDPEYWAAFILLDALN